MKKLIDRFSLLKATFRSDIRLTNFKLTAKNGPETLWILMMNKIDMILLK